MVTAVTNLGRSGLYDWLMQRISAVILLAYTVFLTYVILNGVDYVSWKALFSQTWVKIFSLMALLSLGAHAWVGLWSVITDYFTERMMGQAGNVLRLVLQIVCGLTIFIYVIWGTQILWGY